MTNIEIKPEINVVNKLRVISALLTSKIRACLTRYETPQSFLNKLHPQ